MLSSTPFFFLLENKNINFTSDIKNTILFIILCSIIIGLAYFINSRRKIALDLNFKISNLVPLPLLMACVFFYDIGFSFPLSETLSNNFRAIPILITKNPVLINPFDRMPVLLGSLILAPLFEEIIFRGIILRGFLVNYSPKFAIIVSAVLFGLVHGKPIQIIIALLTGLFLGWIYYKTKSLGTVMAMHFMANFSSQLALFINYKYGSITNTGAQLYGSFTYPVIITSLILFGLSLYYVNKNTKLIPENPEPLILHDRSLPDTPPPLNQ